MKTKIMTVVMTSLLVLFSSADDCRAQNISKMEDISSTSIYVVVDEQKLDTKFRASGAQAASFLIAGGLTFGAGAAERLASTDKQSSSTKGIISSVHYHLSDMDYKKEFEKILQSRLETLSWLKVKPQAVTFVPSLSIKERRQILGKSESNTILFVKLRHYMGTKFQTMESRGKFELWQRDAEKVADENELSYTSISMGGNTVYETISRWTQADGVILQNTMRKSLVNITDSIVDGLSKKSKPSRYETLSLKR